MPRTTQYGTGLVGRLRAKRAQFDYESIVGAGEHSLESAGRCRKARRRSVAQYVGGAAGIDRYSGGVVTGRASDVGGVECLASGGSRLVTKISRE